MSGTANADTGVKATIDTPFYIASQTKSYVGLLAAQLAASGTLPLQTKLADIWPALALPAGADSRKISLLHLLSHQLPFQNDELVIRTSHEAHVPARDYPGVLAGARPRSGAFEYDNLGYLIYAAIVEQTTGTGWGEWLQRLIFEPLGMSRTSWRTSDFALDALAWRHKGENGGWVAKPPKPDALMHAAGGLMSSSRDMAIWLQANLQRRAPAIKAEAFDVAHSQVVTIDQAEGAFHWSGYALGQQVGRLGAVPLLGHRGGYEGARSLAMFAPEQDAGIALMTNADLGTRTLLDAIATIFFKLIVGDGAAEADCDELREAASGSGRRCT